MTERRTAYERAEPRKSAGPVLCIPTVMRGPGGCWRTWVEVDGRDGHPIQHGYIVSDDGTALAIPAAMPRLGPLYFDGNIVPFDRAPVAIREHVLHVIAEIEP